MLSNVFADIVLISICFLKTVSRFSVHAFLYSKRCKAPLYLRKTVPYGGAYDKEVESLRI